MTIRPVGFFAGAFLLLSAPAPVLAHPGWHEQAGFLAGLLHPLSGLDHLVVLFLVGAWGAIAFPRKPWLPPLFFILFMLAGYGLAIAGARLNLVEPVIIVSILAAALALYYRFQPTMLPLVLLIGPFAAAHGLAHEVGITTSSGGLSFAAAFTIMTAMLHLLGYLTARFVVFARFAPRRLPRESIQQRDRHS